MTIGHYKVLRSVHRVNEGKIRPVPWEPKGVAAVPRVLVGYKDQARRRIMDAARSVFRTQGFRSTTMEDIAKELGVSKGAIYLYFPTKTALLSEIQKRSREQVLESWGRLLESGDVARGIAGSVEEVFSGTVDPGIWHELIGEAVTDAELRRAMRVDHREDIAEMGRFLARLEERGRIRKLGDRETVAEIVLALLHGAVLDYMLHGRADESRRTLIRGLRYLLEKGR
jgi:AcrR family transcriptional regulator